MGVVMRNGRPYGGEGVQPIESDINEILVGDGEEWANCNGASYYIVPVVTNEDIEGWIIGQPDDTIYSEFGTIETSNNAHSLKNGFKSKDNAILTIEDNAEVNISDNASLNIEGTATANLEDSGSLNIEGTSSLNIEGAATLNLEDNASLNLEDNSEAVFNNDSNFQFGGFTTDPPSEHPYGGLNSDDKRSPAFEMIDNSELRLQNGVGIYARYDEDEDPNIEFIDKNSCDVDEEDYNDKVAFKFSEMHGVKDMLYGPKIIPMTQEQYDQITPDPNNLYMVTAVNGDVNMYLGSMRMAAAYAVGEMSNSMQSAGRSIVGNFEVLED